MPQLMEKAVTAEPSNPAVWSAYLRFAKRTYGVSHPAPLTHPYYHASLLRVPGGGYHVTLCLCHPLPLPPSASATLCLCHPLPLPPSATHCLCLCHPLPLPRCRVSRDLTRGISGALTRGIRVAKLTRGIRAASAPMACVKSPDGVSRAVSPGACVSILCSCDSHAVGHGVRSGAKATEGSTARREASD